MAKPDQFSGHLSHVGLFPSAGMGHLIPFLRFAGLLLRRNCKLTLITTHPAVSLAESHLISRFLSAFPQVTELKFHLLPLDPSTAGSDDPFILQFETIRRSTYLLPPLIAALSPPISVLVHDVSLISPALMVTATLKLPNYILFISCAKMLSLFAYYPLSKMPENGDSLHIPGVGLIPQSLLPPFLAAKGLFEKIFRQDGEKIKELSGILVNTFEAMEDDSLTALNRGEVLDGLPPVIAMGPLPPCEFENIEENKAPLKWLDNLPPRSVVFICFGNRSALSREQIKEMGSGLVSSGYKFLWVVKTKVVDKEDQETLEEVLGEELLRRVNERGMVVKSWVNQSEILAHGAVGGFMSHCGWNSLMEAAMNGVKILAWPLGGDQKISAEVVVKKGGAVWDEKWGWDREIVVKGEEIAERVKEMMESEGLKGRSAELKAEAMKVIGVGGSSDKAIAEFIEKWKVM